MIPLFYWIISSKVMSSTLTNAVNLPDYKTFWGIQFLTEKGRFDFPGYSVLIWLSWSSDYFSAFFAYNIISSVTSRNTPSLDGILCFHSFVTLTFCWLFPINNFQLPSTICNLLPMVFRETRDPAKFQLNLKVALPNTLAITLCGYLAVEMLSVQN